MSKLFFSLLLLIPSLSWGLTFKNGKQVEEEDQSIEITKNEKFNRLSLEEYLNLSVQEKADYLGISLSGWYIDESVKDWRGKYFLPSPDFFQLVQNQPSIFYKKETAWGYFNDDEIQDIVIHGEGHRCGSGGTQGTSIEQDGRWSCEAKTEGMVNAKYPPFVLFNQDPLTQKVYIKQNVFDFAGPSNFNIGYGSTVNRNVVDDFNGDNIDDIFFTNAQGQNYKGKWVYKGPNHLLISNGPNSWKQGVHTGYKTLKKAQIYTGFSHGATSGDIDNDGDIDIITTEFEGTVCHFNDGQGSFEAKLCNNQLGFTVSAADFNRDGNLDLVVSGGHHNPIYDKVSPSGGTGDKIANRTVLFLGDGKGNFQMKNEKLEPAFGLNGKYMFSTVVEIVAWDFDNDGDADIAGSTVGPFYAGAAWIVYENDGEGNFSIAENIIMPGFEPKEEWKDPKAWAKEILDEHSHPYNAFCMRSTLIDVNDDGLMDAQCNSSKDSGHANWFFINKGDLSFDVVKPEYAEEQGWVNFFDDFQFHDDKKVENEPKIFMADETQSIIIEDNKNYTKLSKDDYLKLSFKERASYLDIGLSGYYIDETLKNKIGKYILPSTGWMRKYVSNNDGIFYRDGASFGDFDGNGRSDYITWGVGIGCVENSSKEGRVGCNSINAKKPPIQIYSVDKSFNFKKLDLNELFDWGKANEKGYPMGSSGILVEDFNNDGIDDFFIANASVKLTNGNFSYDGVNPVMISTGPLKWKASTHTGHKTDRQTNTFNSFAATADTGDIDNDGDIDVITSDFEGAVCHFNDGNGNFKAKLCSNHGGFTLTIGDFNNDGNLDFINAHGHYNPDYKKHSPQKWSSKTKEKMALFYGNGKGEFKFVQILDPYMIGNFMFSDVPDMTAFDFDNDGDVDMVSSSVGMYYAGSVWLAYENIDGQLQISDANVTLAPLDEWQDPKVWGSMVKSESKHPWNTYCSKSQLIDVNNDGLMDVFCNNAVQHYRMTNHFLINKGNMQFDFVKPEDATEWVTWVEDAIVEQITEQDQGPDGEDILRDLEIIIQ